MVYLLFYFSIGFAVTAFYIAFRKKTSPSADREVYKILLVSFVHSSAGVFILRLTAPAVFGIQYLNIIS